MNFSSYCLILASNSNMTSSSGLESDIFVIWNNRHQFSKGCNFGYDGLLNETYSMKV